MRVLTKERRGNVNHFLQTLITPEFMLQYSTGMYSVDIFCDRSMQSSAYMFCKQK